MTETFASDSLESPVGPIGFALSDKGVVAITFLADTTLEKCVPGKAKLIDDARKTRHLKAELKAYFAGELQDFETPPDLRGTEFQQKVWTRLLKIPFGGTLTYGALARGIGNPDASRAVGMANNKNRIGILVPCHRVIGSTGALVGYGGGLDRKKWLLDHEVKVALKAGPRSC